APYYAISWKQNVNRVEGEIEQDSSSFTILLPLRGITSDGSIYNWNIQIHSSVTKFHFHAPKTIAKILIDPDFETLHWAMEFMEMRNAFKAYITAFDLAQSGSFKEAEAILLAALKAEPSNESVGSRFLLNMALGQVNLFGGKPMEAKTYLQNAVTYKTNARHLLPWAYYYLARASKETNDNSLMTHAVQKAIETEHAVGKYIGAARLAEDLQ
ncbi:MAG: hypothetical protein M3342_22060, partial [Bacteroidota bacterium]|nr:hypothetical protein [Bacteroidota bacterium]